MSGLIRTIVTRGYELDARKRLSLGVLARHFEHVRWEALRDPSTGLSAVFEDGRKLVIRAQQIDALTRLVAKQEVTLDVAIAQVGTSSLQFVQRARCGDTLVAYNQVVGVVLDRQGAPTRVPDAVRRLARQEELPPLPRLSERPERCALVCDVYVRPSDLDVLQHVNHARYVDFVDDVYQHAVARGAYGGSLPESPARILVEYRRETRIDPELGPARKLVAHTWREDDQSLGFELVDPVDGYAATRAKIVHTHDGSPRAVAPAGARV